MPTWRRDHAQPFLGALWRKPRGLLSHVDMVELGLYLAPAIEKLLVGAHRRVVLR